MRDPATTVTPCVFDGLWLDGIDCTQLAYRERRRVLEMLEFSGPAWCTVPRFPFEDAEDLLDACARLCQEGIVLKRLDARYTPGLCRPGEAGKSSDQAHLARGRHNAQVGIIVLMPTSA